MDIIGQKSAVAKLQIYAKSYSRTNRLPSLLLTGARGNGKTKLVREFHKTLKDKNGDRPPLIEINGSSVKKVSDFYNQVVPKWKELGAILFLDEIHAIGDNVKENFLTLFEVDENPVRRIVVPDKEEGMIEYEIDFTKVSFICGTTDQQKLSEALLDRFTEVSLQDYSEDELMEILKMNCRIKLCSSIEDRVKHTLAGHPRDAVQKANDLDHFAKALGISLIGQEEWIDFCEIMGVNPYGLTQAELRVLKTVGERVSASLNAISAATGFSRKVIQGTYEKSLMRKNLLEINQKRFLTPKGKALFDKING